jgi:hypothetical protein
MVWNVKVYGLWFKANASKVKELNGYRVNWI